MNFYERGKQSCYYIDRPLMAQGLMFFLTGEYPVVISGRESVCCVTKD